MGNFNPVNESTKNSRIRLCQRFTLPNKLCISVPHIALGGILNELRFMFRNIGDRFPQISQNDFMQHDILDRMGRAEILALAVGGADEVFLVLRKVGSAASSERWRTC